MTTELTIEQIKALIAENEQNYKVAFENLRTIFNEGTSFPFYVERLTYASNLCSEIANDRLKLESALWKATKNNA